MESSKSEHYADVRKREIDIEKLKWISWSIDDYLQAYKAEK